MVGAHQNFSGSRDLTSPLSGRFAINIYVGYRYQSIRRQMGEGRGAVTIYWLIDWSSDWLLILIRRLKAPHSTNMLKKNAISKLDCSYKNVENKNVLRRLQNEL